MAAGYGYQKSGYQKKSTKAAGQAAGQKRFSQKKTYGNNGCDQDQMKVVGRYISERYTILCEQTTGGYRKKYKLTVFDTVVNRKVSRTFDDPGMANNAFLALVNNTYKDEEFCKSNLLDRSDRRMGR